MLRQAIASNPAKNRYKAQDPTGKVDCLLIVQGRGVVPGLMRLSAQRPSLLAGRGNICCEENMGVNCFTNPGGTCCPVVYIAANTTAA